MLKEGEARKKHDNTHTKYQYKKKQIANVLAITTFYKDTYTISLLMTVVCRFGEAPVGLVSRYRHRDITTCPPLPEHGPRTPPRLGEHK